MKRSHELVSTHPRLVTREPLIACHFSNCKHQEIVMEKMLSTHFLDNKIMLYHEPVIILKLECLGDSTSLQTP